MHHLPCEMESDHSRKPRTARDGGQQHNMQHREEHAEVARRRNPQLNVGHALERALYLGYAGYEADRQQYRHVGRAHGYEVAHGYHHSRADKQKAVGEAEFHAEEHRKPHRHARKSGIKQHQQVFNHQIRCAAHSFQRTEIDSARKLYAQHCDYVQPRLDAAWHPLAVHRHGKRHPCLIW